MSREIKDKDGLTWTIDFSTGEGFDCTVKPENYAPSTQGSLIFECNEKGYIFCKENVFIANMTDKQLFAWIEEYIQSKQ